MSKIKDYIERKGKINREQSESRVILKSFSEEILDDLKTTLVEADAVIIIASNCLDGTIENHSDSFLNNKINQELERLKHYNSELIRLKNKDKKELKLKDIHNYYVKIVKTQKSLKLLREYTSRFRLDNTLFRITSELSENQ